MTDPLAALMDSDVLRRFLGGTAMPGDEVELRRLAVRAGVASDDLDGLRELVVKDELWRRVARKTGLDVDLIWQGPAAPSSVPSSASVSAARSESIAHDVVPRGAGGERRQRQWRARPWWGSVAAALAIAAGGALVWRSATPEPMVATHVIAAQPGQRIQYRLPDGSRVILAPESQLRYGAWDGSSPRTVELDRGQAYFDVVHDEARPFRVRVAGAVVEDIGTEFVVRAYPQDNSPYVAVRSGSVGVRPGAAPVSESLLLEPGHVARINANGTATRVSADTSVLLGWTDGQLVFRDTPAAEVIRQLRRWYAIDVVADPGLLGTEITLALTERNTPADAVEYVAGILDARVERHGTVFVLRR